MLVLVLGLAELRELRGEFAFARFDHLRRLARTSRSVGDLTRAVENASAEAELVMLFAESNVDALEQVAVSSLWWSAEERLEPLLRLRLGEKAVRAAALAVRAAPSDYEPWLWLARTQASLGLWKQAERCLARAEELAPAGQRLELLAPRKEPVRASTAEQVPG